MPEQYKCTLSSLHFESELLDWWVWDLRIERCVCKVQGLCFFRICSCCSPVFLSSEGSTLESDRVPVLGSVSSLIAVLRLHKGECCVKEEPSAKKGQPVLWCPAANCIPHGTEMPVGWSLVLKRELPLRTNSLYICQLLCVSVSTLINTHVAF